MVEGPGWVNWVGDRRPAEAIIKYKDRDEERMVLRSTTMVLNLFEKWIGLPFYDRDAWMKKEEIENAFRTQREEAARLKRKRDEEAAKAEAERAKLAEEESVRRKAEEARKRAEEAANERANPLLSIESMRKCIVDFFESVKATYPGFKTSMMRVGRDSMTSVLHIECTIDLNPSYNVISPIYPNAREIYITNHFYWPPNGNGDKPDDNPVRFIIKPEGKNIVEFLGIRPLDRVSDITECLRHVFPENGDARRIIAEKQAGRQVQERIQARRAESKSRVKSAVSALANKLIRELENEMRHMNVTITNAEGTDVSMSLYDACPSLDVSASTSVTEALFQQRGLRSAITKVSETLNRITLHT
jgi:sRNA-binding protein